MTIITIILVVLASLIAVGNIHGCIAAMLRRRRGDAEGFSTLPLLSLVFSVVAWIIAPDRFGMWVLLPAVVDPANWFLAALPVFLLQRAIRSDESPSPTSAPARPNAVSGTGKLAHIRSLLIDELARAITYHESTDYRRLGATLFEIDDLIWKIRPKQARKESIEYQAYCLLDSWLDAANHDWLPYEVPESEWPRLGRKMMDVLKGKRKFRFEDYPGVLTRAEVQDVETDWRKAHKAHIATFPPAIRDAHAHSSGHREEVLASTSCGCFHCQKVYPPQAITEWTDEDESGEGQTALCPMCGVDSVIGDGSGFPLTPEFLGDMYRYWFG